MSSSFFVNTGGSAAERETISNDLTASANSKADAQKLAINAEDAQFTLSDGTTTGNSALHHAAKAEASATSAAGSESTATQQAGIATQAKTDAQAATATALIYRDAAITANNNSVLLTGAQAIAGAKTFSNAMTVNDTITADGISVGDAQSIYVGAGNDLEIVHRDDGSQRTDIIETGGGNLRIAGRAIELNNDSGTNEYQIVLDGTGATNRTKLFAGQPTNSSDYKLMTTATGVEVKGTVTATGIALNGNMETDGNITVQNGHELRFEQTDGTESFSIKTSATTTNLLEQGSGNLNIKGDAVVICGNNTDFQKITCHDEGGVKILSMASGDATDSYMRIKTGDQHTGTRFYCGTDETNVRAEVVSAGLNVNGTVTADVLTVDSSSSVVATIGSSGSSAARLYFDNTGMTTAGDTQLMSQSNDLAFNTNGAERMRIESSGNVLVNGGTTRSSLLQINASATNEALSTEVPQTTNASHLAFINPNGTVGFINTSGSSTTYATSSDYRLKTDAQPMVGATARLKALNPVNFEWIADGTRVDGFLAHEAATVVPESVTGTKDAMKDEEYEVTPAVLDDDDNVVTEAVMGTRSVPDYQGIDQAKLVPLLVATIQELEARITALES